MPQLPTVTVTQAQMDRLLAVFVDGPGYKAWLIGQLKQAVINHELGAMRQQARAAEETRRAEVSADLDTAT